MNSDELEETRSPYYTRPWRRFFAKKIDVSIFVYAISVVLGVVLAIMKPEWTEMSRAESIAFGVIAVIASIPLEAACLSRFGTTFGKFLMGTRVVNCDGANMTYANALSRTAKSYVLGLAAGLPFVQLLTMSVGYNQLENEGSVIWDRSEKTYVVHKDMERWRWILGFSTFSLVVLISTLSAAAFRFAEG